MCQIDWDVKFKNRSFAIATFTIATFAITTCISLPLIPSALFAETQSTTSHFQDDPPEEVLRAEIYTDARSPIDGKQLTAAEYTELMERLRSLDGIPPEDLVSPKVQEVIGLLRLRKFLRQFIPFIP